MSPLTQQNRKITFILGGAFVAVALVSAVLSHTLIGSDASRATSQDRYAELQRATAAGRPIAPYLGPFAQNPKLGRQCGAEVRLMEGALRRTKPPIRKTKARNCIGAATTRQIKTFQRRHHLPPSGIYGKRTHRALSHAYTRRMRADLAYIAAIRLRDLRVKTIGIVTAHAKAQEGLMQYCNFGSLSFCSRRWDWPAYPDVPRHTDCSGYATWVYFQSGLPDPNGLGYNGGFTGTLVAHGNPVPPNGPLHVGDLIFNGPSASNTTHVSVYIGHGLSSGHGRAGIQIHPWNYRFVVAIRRYFA